MSDSSNAIKPGKVLIEITPDGNVKLAKGLSLSAASKLFWKEVQNHGPAKRLATVERLLVAMLTNAATEADIKLARKVVGLDP